MKNRQSTLPQFQDHLLNICHRHNLSLRATAALVLYYGVFRNFPGNLGTKIRTSLCRRIFHFIGSNTTILRGVSFGVGTKIALGNNSSINSRCWIANDTVIGEDVMMGPEVIILSGGHNFDRLDIPMRAQGAMTRRPVTIGNDVWIGTRAIILPGVVIGDHAIIGAGAVVAKSIPPYAIAVGNPAQIKRFRNTAQN